MILATNCFQFWDLILLRHQFRRYVEHLFECEICRVRNGVTIILEILSHEYCWFLFYSHEHFLKTYHVFLHFSVTFKIRFCLIRTWSFTWFKNDLDFTDNANSSSWFPMTNCWGHTFSWESVSDRPDLSRCVSSFITDCAIPSCRISSWEK